VTVSKARQLLDEASEPAIDDIDRHLLVAAAVSEVLDHEPVVVGGTAEDYYAADMYVPTDLDLCGWVAPDEEAILADLGFERDGRHWYHPASKIAVEFPESRIAGDEDRIKRVRIGSGEVALIGVEDLYLDRVRAAASYQGTWKTSIEFRGAIAIGVAAYEDIDWAYVDRGLTALKLSKSEHAAMRDVHKAVRRRVLAALKKL
jgi:hypothetical protein